MKIIVLITIVITFSFVNYHLWFKLKIVEKFYRYKSDLKIVLASIRTLDTNKLDRLSLSGLILTISVLIFLIPIILSYLFIFKLYGNNLIALILSSLTFLALTQKSF